MNKLLATSLLLLAVFCASAQKTDRALQRQLEALIQGYHGKVGIYVEDLRRNRVAVAGSVDSVFPTASIVKIPILIGVMSAVEAGRLDWHGNHKYRDSLLYAGVDLLGSFKQDESIELSKLVMLMMSMSDNTASLWLQSLAGGGTRINAIMDSMGLQHTRVNSRTPGREEARSVYGWGQSTPREMAGLMKRIYRGGVISPVTSGQMIRLMSRNYWDGEALSQIPPDIFTASKNGAVNASRSEVVLVRDGKSEYLFCIMTGNNKDERWTDDNEAWVLIRKVSKLLWSELGSRGD